MSKSVQDILLEEVRMNRKEITALRNDVHKLDKDVMGNKMKLSLFIGGVSLLFNLIWAIVVTKIKTMLT